jgi:ABC-type branched-subunit amino acid transport system permease subunit
MRSLQARRALNNGLIAGATIIFFILIGIPGGASDAEGLPAWFVWGLFMLTAMVFGLLAARARSVTERRTQTLAVSAVRGLIVGLAAASMTIAAMCAINAAQLLELSLPKDAATLPNGLKSNITRVQDVLANVNPRTTAVMAGLPVAAIQQSTLRADPVARFFVMAALLPIAATVGGALSWTVRLAAERREQRAHIAPPTERPALRWLPIALPFLFFAFIVFNAVAPGVSSQYRALIGTSGQLAGLLASFFLIGTGLIGIRSASDERDATPFRIRAAVLVIITLVIFSFGLVAPTRSASDLMFSPKAPNPVQVVTPGGAQVVTNTPAPVDDNTLDLYRKLVIIGIGLLIVVANFLSARGATPLRKLVATNVLLCTLAVAPLYLDKYQQSVLLLVGINIMLGLGLNIVVGYAGLLDLGYVAFFAIGAYVYAFLSSNEDVRNAGTVIGLKFGGNDQLVQLLAVALFVSIIVTPVVIAGGLLLWRRRASSDRQTAKGAWPAWLSYALVGGSIIASLIVIGLLRGTPFYDSFADFPAFVIGILLGMGVAAFAGVLLGIPVLRLRGDYLAIVTLGFGEIIRLFLNNLRDITGGPQGVISIPHATFGNVEMGSNEGLLYLVLAGCLFVAFLSLRLKSSRLGRAWGALRSDEDIAQAMGIHMVSTKVLAFAIGAAFAGIGGVIFAARQANIFPDNFTLNTSINVLCLIIIGGMGSVPGVIVGALVLIGVPESLRVFESYRVMAFGALLVAMMLLRPSGLLPEPPEPMEHRAQVLAGKELHS